MPAKKVGAGTGAFAFTLPGAHLSQAVRHTPAATGIYTLGFVSFARQLL